MTDLNIIKDSTELRKLIAENPELPIVVLASEDSWNEESFAWCFCSNVRAAIDEILDCELPFGYGKVFNDRDEFEEELAIYLDVPDEDIFQRELEKYNPYWKKVIAIYADN